VRSKGAWTGEPLGGNGEIDTAVLRKKGGYENPWPTPPGKNPAVTSGGRRTWREGKPSVDDYDPLARLQQKTSRFVVVCGRKNTKSLYLRKLSPLQRGFLR
jgi:hypothetical protein